MTRTKKIGVFDSGFGGLAILKDIVKELPQYDYVYLGDNARTPYGTRSSDIVHAFTRQAVEFLFAHGCELVVIACNTASADALRRIQQEYVTKDAQGKRVLGVIVPAVEEAVARTKNKRIGVMATEGTVRSNAFVRELTLRDPALRVFQQAAPLLVPLVEAGEFRSKPAELILRNYLKPLLAKKIDTLVLGCTHYGHMGKSIKQIVGKNVTVISEGPVVAKKLREYLSRHPELEKKLSRRKHREFYSTDLSDRFQRLGALFFGKRIVSKKVTFV